MMNLLSVGVLFYLSGLRKMNLLSVGVILYLSGLGSGKVIQVGPGSDVSVRCVDRQSNWDRISANSIELRLDDTAHLLVQNFQQQDKGLYRCGSKEEITLEEKHGSGGVSGLLYRAVGQEARLFCKHLGTEACNGTWTRPHHRSNNPEVSAPVSPHSGRDKDFSWLIPSVKWGDSGVFQCEMRCNGYPNKLTSYELVVVKATVEPQRVYEEGHVRLCCSVSHQKTSGQVWWIQLDSNNQNSRRYRGTRYNERDGEFCLTVRNILPEQSLWACAVFHRDSLRALLPLRVNVSKHTTTHTPPTYTTPHTPRTLTTAVGTATTLQATHNESTTDTRDATATQKTESSGVHGPLISVFGLVGLALVILTSVFLWRRTNKGEEVCEDEGECEEDEEDECAGGLPSRRESVTYSVVHLKRKPTENLNKAVASTDPLTAVGDTDDEYQTVIYAGLKMNQ